MNKIIVYTDGSAIGNGKENSRCGWACKLIYHGHELMKSGRGIGYTNNQMEMTAVLMAMKSITDKTIPVELYSDSRYVVETLNGNYSINANSALWDELIYEKAKFSSIQFLWVKGHAKNQHNKDVDRTAFEESQSVAPATLYKSR